MFGEEHPDTLASMNKVAQILRARGNYNEAEHMFAQMHEMQNILAHCGAWSS